MSGLTLADRLAATRDQLEVLAQALGRVDVEAIEASAQALAYLVADLPVDVPTGAGGAAEAAEAPDTAAIDDLRWQLLRCRRLGAQAAALGTAAPLYRPDGQTRTAAPVYPRLEVAG